MPSGVKARIAIFASGAGSNADKICTYFNSHPSIQVNLILSNRQEAGVIDVADRHHIDVKYISKKKINYSQKENTIHLQHNKHNFVHKIFSAIYTIVVYNRQMDITSYTKNIRKTR